MKNLTDLMYELLNEGIIYEEDENGLGMSYGEEAAIIDYLRGYVEEQLERASTLEEGIRIYKEIVIYSDDDGKMFAGIDEDDEEVVYLFSEEYVEDEDGGGHNIYVCSDPERITFRALKELWEEYEGENYDLIELAA